MFVQCSSFPCSSTKTHDHSHAQERFSLSITPLLLWAQILELHFEAVGDLLERHRQQHKLGKCTHAPSLVSSSMHQRQQWLAAFHCPVLQWALPPPHVSCSCLLTHRQLKWYIARIEELHLGKERMTYFFSSRTTK